MRGVVGVAQKMGDTMANEIPAIGAGHAYAPGQEPEAVAPIMFALTEGSGGLTPIFLLVLLAVGVALVGGLLVLMREMPRRHRYRDSLAERRKREAEEIAKTMPRGGHGALLRERMR